MNTITQYNENLVRSIIQIELDMYIEETIGNFFPKLKLDFAREVAPLIMNEEFCVPHTLFVKHKILKSARWWVIKRFIKKNELYKGAHYKVVEGTYYFAPNVYEIGIMKMYNPYYHQYILLRDVIAHFNEYKFALKFAMRYKQSEVRVERAEDELKNKDKLIGEMTLSKTQSEKVIRDLKNMLWKFEMHH